MTGSKIGCAYLARAYCDWPGVVRDAKRDLPEIEPDTLVGVGLSGAIVVPRLADILDLNWLMVRKERDGSHSTYKAEGVLGHRWAFVDDLISGGGTYRHVRSVVADVAIQYNITTEHVGAWLYDQYGAGASLDMRAVPASALDAPPVEA